MKSKKASRGIFVDVAVLIVCIAIATSCLASGILAKYVTGADSNRITARTAAFTVGATLDRSAYTVDLTGTESIGKYILKLSNNSEVAVNYTVILAFDEKVDGFITASLDGQEASKDDTGMIFTWENAGAIAPGSSELAAELELIVNGTGYTTDKPYDFNVNIIFTQIN